MLSYRSSLLVALTSMMSSCASAWVSTSTASFVTPSASASCTTRLFSAVESTETGAKVTLKPEYQAALEAAKEKVMAGLGEKKAHLMKPLEHFVAEYVGCAQTAMEKLIERKGGEDKVTDEEKARFTPQAAAQRILTGISYAQKFGMPDSPEFYHFDVTHQALRGNPETEHGNTVDYYAFGCDFFRNCMDLEKSVVLGRDNLDKAMEQLRNGENVIFLANHQSEADPQVVSCMLEKAGYEREAADMIYVAGHKVTTDPLAIPFSMGRNLICIHSKKHINAEPESKSKKQRQNLQAMSAMLKKFSQGGCLLWVAPSGGRDRRDLETGLVPPAPFDSKTIDMFRLMGNKSKKPMHYYPMAMVSYDLCPPPDYVEAGVGEQRNVRYVPVGIYVGEEADNVGGVESRKDFCQTTFEACLEDYKQLEQAIKMEE